jgi:D-galactarolactone isomerase
MPAIAEMSPLPPGSCDCHIHIYGPPDRYAPNRSVPWQPLPNSDVADNLAMRQRLGINRTVIVQAAAYGTDNRCSLDAAKALGDSARVVATVDPASSDEQLRELSRGGVRGQRYFMFPGGALGWDVLERMSARGRSLGWHIQLQLPGEEIAEQEQRLSRLPSDLVIDHIGRFQPGPEKLDHPSFKALIRLVEGGRCWVKLSAPYLESRSTDGNYDDVAPMVRALVRLAPDRMLWASNWPHPTVRANPPDDRHLLQLFYKWIGDGPNWQRILVENPKVVYGFR